MAAVITFDLLAESGTCQSTVSSPYTEADYQLSNTFSDFAFHQNESPDYAGSTGLFALFGGTTTLTRVGGELFHLLSIDLAPIIAGSTPDPITFTGLTSDPSVVTQSFTGSSTLAFQTFVFSSSFENLASVSWKETLLAPQYDNVTTFEVGSEPPVVPEPSSAVLLMSGLAAGLLVFRRREQTAAPHCSRIAVVAGAPEHMDNCATTSRA